jgi:crossover junction endodeoxyribonuclease RusA
MITLNAKPISVNRLYQGRRFLTKEGQALKDAIYYELKPQWKKPLLIRPVSITLKFYVTNRRSDLDNLLKALLDCLTGVIYKDDSQIVEIHCYKKISKESKIEIDVNETNFNSGPIEAK